MRHKYIFAFGGSNGGKFPPQEIIRRYDTSNLQSVWHVLSVKMDIPDPGNYYSMFKIDDDEDNDCVSLLVFGGYGSVSKT